MSDVNFLNSKKNDDDQKPKENKREEVAWSNPEKEIKSSKSSPFSFFSSLNKKPVDKNSVTETNKNKIKQSREEILDLIKRHGNSNPLPKERNNNFLSTFGEKLKKQPAPKEVLIDYQQAFKREKEHKNQVGQFNIKPEIENKPAPKAVVESKGNWSSGLMNFFKKDKMTPPNINKNETTEKIELSKVEEIKPAVVKESAPIQPIVKKEESLVEVKEIKIEEKESTPKNETRQRVLETNLIQGELVTFFDWRSKITITLGAILIPLFIVGAIYYSLVFYQKSSQANNLAQAQKFVELEQNIKKEETGLKEISDFQARLKIISKVFRQHLYWTNFFKFLEDNTIKDVYFINFDGDTSGNYAMDALTANYSSIAEQVNIFKNSKKITAVLAEGGEMVAGDDKNKSLVKFILNFSISKNIFTE